MRDGAKALEEMSCPNKTSSHEKKKETKKKRMCGHIIRLKWRWFDGGIELMEMIRSEIETEIEIDMTSKRWPTSSLQGAEAQRYLCRERK